MWRHILPLIVGIVIVLAVGIGVMIYGPSGISDDAVATLTGAALGILGTHVAHVSGHALGQARKD
jgi:hypothetical protein